MTAISTGQFDPRDVPEDLVELPLVVNVVQPLGVGQRHQDLGTGWLQSGTLQTVNEVIQEANYSNQILTDIALKQIQH